MAFIVFEGIDGSGKSTLVRKLNEYLVSKGISCVLTREPGGTELAEELRHIIIRTDKEAPTPRTELLLYEAARAQHVDKFIQPNLDQGNWVISDRFSASTYAFQAGGRELKDQDIHWLNNFATNGLEPDLWVLLDLPITEAEKRMGKRLEEGQQKDRFEQEKQDFHQRVRDAYLSLSKDKDNWLILDSTQTPDDLYEQLRSHLIHKGLVK